MSYKILFLKEKLSMRLDCVFYYFLIENSVRFLLFFN